MEELTGRIAKKLRGELLKLGLNDPVVSQTAQAIEVIIHGELFPLFELPCVLDERIEVHEDGKLWKYQIKGAGTVTGFLTPHEAAVTAIRHLIHIGDQIGSEDEIDLKCEMIGGIFVKEAISTLLSRGRVIISIVPIVESSVGGSQTRSVHVYHRRAGEIDHG